MGTRNSTIVKLDGEVRVAQYGQWDGYPTGQGQAIADFLREVDLEKFKKQVSKLREITKKEEEKVNNSENWQREYPYLSRDTGADILNMIARDEVKFLVLDKDFKDDGLFCEYWYELDLDKQTVTMNGQGFTFAEWIQDDFMKKLEERENDE